MPIKRQKSEIVASEAIESKIRIIRDKKVMLDRDLAALYHVETKALNQAVKRNIDRFPEDFMFQLMKEEVKNWKSQIVTSNKEKMGLRKMPYAFTEQGVAMLSSVLNSPIAISVNIQIMRTFVNLRRMATDRQELWLKIDEMEKKYDKNFKVVFNAIRLLLDNSKDEPGKRW